MHYFFLPFCPVAKLPLLAAAELSTEKYDRKFVPKFLGCMTAGKIIAIYCVSSNNRSFSNYCLLKLQI